MLGGPVTGGKPVCYHLQPRQKMMLVTLLESPKEKLAQLLDQNDRLKGKNAETSACK